MPRAIRKTALPPSFKPVEGLYEVSAKPGPGNLMTNSAFKSRVIDWHAQLNRISGQLVLAHTQGCTEAQLREMAHKIRTLGQDMDPG